MWVGKGGLRRALGSGAMSLGGVRWGDCYEVTMDEQRGCECYVDECRNEMGEAGWGGWIKSQGGSSQNSIREQEDTAHETSSRE